MDKKSLRQRGRVAAKTTKEQHGSVYDKQICERFFSINDFPPRTVISGFMALKGEVSCESIIRQLGHKNLITCLPVVMGLDNPMVFREYAPGDSTKPGLMGQMEPLDQAPEMTPDVVIVPMLGFNREGYRLGYGSGFYDRTLSVLRAQKKVKVIGLAYSEQEMPELAHEDHDEPMDVIITEKEVIRVK